MIRWARPIPCRTLGGMLLLTALVAGRAAAVEGEVGPAVPAAATGRTSAARLDDLEVYVGRSFFHNPWVAAPSSTTARDGLGPLFNAHACSSCHPSGRRGRSIGEDAASPALLLRLGVPPIGGGPAAPEPSYGTQLQTRGVVSGPARVPAEGTLGVAWETSEVELAGGERVELRRPRPRVAELAYGPLDERVCFSLRMAPSLRGAGLLDAIPESAILAAADPDDRDGDGISGRVRRVRDQASGETRVGRFGHRSAQPTLRQQVAAAFRDDVGITSALFPEQPCTERQELCRKAPSGTSAEAPFEIDDRLLNAVTRMTERLAVPAPSATRVAPALIVSGSEPARQPVDQGRALFERVGCAGCHRPSLTDPADPSRARPDSGDRRPYTDLLLHDLGPGLADPCDEADASGSEWRTAPLWGLGSLPADGALLHDGRARGILEAILWHGGEAEAARRRFAALDRSQRASLIAFIEGL